MRIDFYYWSYQCPLNGEMLQLLKEYQDKFDIYYHDISIKKEKTQDLKMYFPTLTVVDEKYKYFSPLTKEFLNQLYYGDYPIEKPYQPHFYRNEYHVDISPIVSDNIDIAGLCTGKKCTYCHEKKDFLNNFDISIYGYINHEGKKLLGGAEYVPSLIVPYDIPKGEEIAFITCIYSPYVDVDAKTAPLQALENHLKDKYKKVIVISDEKGNFPTGDISFFIQNGYLDCGIVLKEDYCVLHLMEKYLK